MEGKRRFDQHPSPASLFKTPNSIFNKEINKGAERNLNSKAVPDLQSPQHFLGLSRGSRLQSSDFSAPHSVYYVFLSKSLTPCRIDVAVWSKKLTERLSTKTDSLQELVNSGRQCASVSSKSPCPLVFQAP